MIFSKERLWALGILIIGIVVLFLIFHFLPGQEKTIVNGFTLFGTFLSLFALAFTYLQIQSVNRTSVETKQAIEKSLQRINQILSVSELSKANKIIQEIQNFIYHEKHEIALIRMRDLKSILIQVKYNEDLLEYTNNNIYNKNITDLGSDINNLHDHLSGHKSGLNKSKLNKNLENLATIITDLEHKLKYKSYDA